MNLDWETCKPHIIDSSDLWMSHTRQIALCKTYCMADCNCIDFMKWERISHTVRKKKDSGPREGILKVISQSGNKIKGIVGLLGRQMAS